MNIKIIASPREYSRDFHRVEILVGKKVMILNVEVEGEKIIRHNPLSEKDRQLWNNLSYEEMQTVESALRDEFEF